ncbi:MAG: beta-ketoacyl-ACP synthase II [Chloroflexi bacterium]|nr:MAG: beta-ketoacyl-ACP synthase II [Chloroflexota bacterium]
MGHHKRMVITGMGALSPVGNDVPSLWQAMKQGRSGVAPITHFDAAPYETRFAAEVKGFDALQFIDKKEARRMDRFVQFAIAATQEALADAGLEITPQNAERVAVGIGTGIGGVGMLSDEIISLHTRGPRRVSPFFIASVLPDSASGQVAITYGAKGNNIAVTAACATGGTALGEAMSVLARGDADVIITGSSEAALVPICFAGFNIMNALSRRNDEPAKASRPFDKTRDGFVVGEGAGILILETEEHARARGARIYAELAGYGMTADANHMVQPGEGGEGMARAMQVAMKHARVEAKDVQYINAHGTSTPLNDKTETLAIKRAFGEHAYDVPISSTKSMIGHCFGAAGSLEAIITIKAMQENVLPPTINYETPDPECDLDYVPNVARAHQTEIAMSNAMGLGGHNSCVIFRKI